MKPRKKILITGMGGFVGQNIFRCLLKEREDLDIYNYSRTPVDHPRVKNIFCDATISDPSDIDIQFDYIIHLLALSNEAYCSNFPHAQQINIEFTKKMLVFVEKQKHLKKFIHMSSIIVYDNAVPSPVPENSRLYLNYSTYSFTKGISEYYVNFFREKFGIPTIIFRLSNIYGPFQRFVNSPFLIPSKVMQGIDEGKIEVASLTPMRDWIYSGDAAEAVVLALDSEYSGIMNLGVGKGTSVEDIIKIVSEELNVPYFSKNQPTTGPLNFFSDVSTIKKVLGWEAKTDMRTGLQNTIRYIKENKK